MLIAALAALAYSAVSGLATPAQRATLMLGLGALVFMRRRATGPLTILAASCAMLVVADPLISLAPGFKLSFLAVLVLLWTGMRSAGVAGRQGAGLFLDVGRGLLSMQFGLLFGLLPVTVIAFQRISLVAPFVNLLAVPLFGIVTVPCALIGLIFAGPLATIGDLALRLSAASVELLDYLLIATAQPPFAMLRVARIEGFVWAAVLLAPAWVVFPPGWPARSVSIPAVFAIACHGIDGPAPGCVNVRLLDVGQGLSAVVRTERRTLLYDTGPAFPGGTR